MKEELEVEKHTRWMDLKFQGCQLTPYILFIKDDSLYVDKI